MRDFLARGLGGINFRDDSTLERICRTLGVLRVDPVWFLGPVRRWLRGRLAELGTSFPALVREAIRGKIRLGAFSVVSHHFMSAAETMTGTGKERLAACLFRVPIDGEMVQMCRVNAEGVRAGFYAGLPPRPAVQPDRRPLEILPS